MENPSQALGVLAFVGVITIVAFLVCRELVCWYWKINRTVELLEKISSQLESGKTNIGGSELKHRDSFG